MFNFPAGFYKCETWSLVVENIRVYWWWWGFGFCIDYLDNRRLR